MTVIVPPYLACDSDAKRRFPLIADVARKHPFHRARLTGVPLEVPLMTREDILADNDKLLGGHPETARTSGSTGVPVRVSWSDRRQKLEFAQKQMALGWAGATPKAISFIHMTETRRGSELKFDVRLPLTKQLALILKAREVRGTVGVTTYPTNIEMLAQEVLDRGLDMGFIEVVGLFAEVFEPHQEKLIQKAFPNALIWSVYSSMEMGVMAVRCRHDPEHHHILSHKVGFEILNDQNEPCGEGELGRIVVTDYFNAWSPFLRYDIGDLAAPSRCPCGQTDWPSFSQLAGKIRGALRHRDGRRIPFTNLSTAIRDIPGVRQYQVIQHEVERFEVRIARDRAGMSDEAFLSRLGAEFEKEFGYRPQISLTPEERIDRGVNGKFYASISKV